MFSVLFEDAPAFKMPQLSSYTPKYSIPWDLMPLDITHITVKNTCHDCLTMHNNKQMVIVSQLNVLCPG